MGRALPHALGGQKAVHSHLVAEFLDWVFPLHLLQLGRSVLVEELVNAEVATAHPNVNLVFVDFDAHTLAAELVNALRLTHEHDLELLAVRVVIDVLRDLFVDLVVLHRNVHGDARLQIDDVVAQHFNLSLQVVHIALSLLQLLNQVKRRALRLVEFVFQLEDIGAGGI